MRHKSTILRKKAAKLTPEVYFANINYIIILFDKVDTNLFHKILMSKSHK